MKAERYTIQYSADQLLLQPECPVHVKKLQCTRDNLTGSLLLQIRYVNRSERTVEGLVIRVQIRDSAGQVLTDLRALPVGGLCAAPHHCFGDEKTVILPRAPGDLRVLVEQVQFSDGYLWRSKPEAPLLRVCEPVRICGRVQPSQHGDYWYCACGLVNPAKAPVCGYCGKRSPFGAAAPSAAVSVPAAAPRPAQAVPAASAPPVFVPDCYVFPTPSADTAGYLPQSPLNAAAPVPAAAPAQEFPVIEPRKEEPEKKSHKALWITLLVVLVLACVAAVYFFGYPLYQYRRAMDAQAAGNYAQAASLYESLGDYDDAATRLSECRYLQAQGLAEDGDYAGALKLYEALGDYSDSAAQAEACKLQQAQGLFDDGNYKRAYKALADVAESEERDELLSQCLQQLCKQALDSEDADTARVYLEEEKSMSLTPVPAWIDEAERHCTYLDARKAYAAGSYDEAEEGFRSSSYDDYADWINACEYAKAKALADQKEYTQGCGSV
jgi:predicted negative regulator of RcsB-dependent stress response